MAKLVIKVPDKVKQRAETYLAEEGLTLEDFLNKVLDDPSTVLEALREEAFEHEIDKQVVDDFDMRKAKGTVELIPLEAAEAEWEKLSRFRLTRFCNQYGVKY